MRSSAAPLLAALIAGVCTTAPSTVERDEVRQAPASTRQAPAFRLALPGYRYEFPRDHFDHPDFQTEWWYYTGNLRASDGHRFGFELTFFRHALDREPAGVLGESPWTIRDVYLAHFAISDLDSGTFVYDERVNRAGRGLAGIDRAAARVWNGNWRVQWEGGRQRLEAVSARCSLALTLVSAKPPVIHGVDGVSQKAAGPGRASHYISLTRLDATGAIGLDGARREVSGTAWMDHEFFTNQLGRDQLGWDWVGLQFDDRTELMAGRIRRSDGASDAFSMATFVAADGISRRLTSADFTLTPLGETWTSAATHATYPVAWRLRVPSLAFDVEIRAALPSQELAAGSGLTPAYWEGAIAVRGARADRPVTGVGYLEMTGYKTPR